MEKIWIETEFMREVRTEKGRAARRGGGAVSLTRLDGNGTGTESGPDLQSKWSAQRFT